MNYKRLGDYIQEVNIRNTDLSVDTLLGVSIQKVLMPSIANTIGTNMKTYKIIRKNQFIYGAVTSRNGDKISIALLEDYDEAIVSQAYTVFEITDTKKLLPEYLMMWFRRLEFDRYARYKSHGSARETFDWDEMCEVELPIPSIGKQQQIVDEYNSVANRIALNNKINQKLEETAQTLYKNWFVDFEFPNEKGLPYKSSGGKMVYNEELDKEIPLGWKVKELTNVFKISAGGDRPKEFSEVKNEKFSIPIFSNGITDKGLYGYTNKSNYPKNSITISARGTIGYTELRIEPFDAIVRLLVLTPKIDNQEYFWFLSMKNMNLNSSGSVQKQLTKPYFEILSILFPSIDVMIKFEEKAKPIFEKIKINTKQNQQLRELKDLLLVRMSE